MLGFSGMLGSSDDGGAAAEARESGGNGSSSNGGGGGEVGGVAGPSTGGLSEEEKVGIGEVDRNSGGNRWPRQETLALLKIRSDMDGAFRDSSLKGPLWEEVSRKLAELGYHRSAKKCKEKFENVFKYHKRTKDGRSSKPDGKTYRFFDQLEALENQPPPPPQQFLPPPRSQTTLQPPTPATPVSVALPGTNNPLITVSHVSSTVPSNPIILSQNIVNPTTNAFPSNPLPTPPPAAVPATATIGNPINLSQNTTIPASTHANMSLNFGSISTSSSTSSDEDPERGRKRKRKWEHFFQRLMKQVVEKQEEMQKKFLETLERRERDRVAREEAWRVQEMARMNREHDLLVQERSMAAAKDAAVIAFLQKVSDQQIPNVAQLQRKLQVQQVDNPIIQPPPPPPPRPPIAQKQPPPPPQSQPQPQPQPQLQLLPQLPVENVDNPKTDNGGGENLVTTSSSRWPKAEVESLIRLRTNMDTKYQESGPKGPLWEEISAAMRRIGYSRSAKRCKEKWENINKYFKKVKESNKKRPEDSKTCPYFHQLEALYKEKAKSIDNSNNSLNPMIPIMVQPEQQWPLPPQEQQQQQHHQHEHRPGESSAMEDRDSENVGDDNDDGDDEEDDEDEAGGYEIVTSKPSSVGAAE